MRKSVVFLLLFVSLALILTSCHRHVRNPSDIRPGMTREDVTKAWGGTYLITHQTRDGRPLEVWDYHFSFTNTVCRVIFYQDRVTTTECWRRGPWWY